MNKPLGGHVYGYMASQELVSQCNDLVRMPNNVMNVISLFLSYFLPELSFSKKKLSQGIVPNYRLIINCASPNRLKR